MSGSHLSKELFDLIKSIGEARSKQEEDKIILNEAHQLTDRFKEKRIPDKKMKEYLIRAIYVELLGHNASFAHIAAINMSQSKSLKLKRLAYLACTLFLTEKSQSEILLVATLQKDMQSKVDLEVAAALTTLCKIVNVSILEAVMDPVYKLLGHKSSLIRKKAVMVVHKFYMLNPALADDIDAKMKKALCDKDPCVMAAALNYFYTVVKANPNRYKDLVSSFVVILKQVIEHRLPKEYDFHRMPAPWIQMKLLAILALLGQYDQSASEGMYEVLGLTIRRADDLGINIGYAIVYQCLKTIITIYPYKSLIELAATTISRFLNTDNKNLKYVGITGLSLIVSVNPDFVLQHQGSIVECLEDSDETLKGKTIDLLYRMTNYKNVSAIVEKFLTYLRTSYADSPLRKELVFKINQLAERFATNKTWFINTTNRLFEISGDLITPEITNSFIRLISDWEEDAEAASFRKYAINLYLEILKNSAVVSDALMEVMTFVIGLYGPEVITEEKELVGVIQLLCRWTEYPFNSERIKGLILTAVLKLHKALGYRKIDEVDTILGKFVRSKNTELTQRAVEHMRLRTKPAINVGKLFSDVEDPDEGLSFLSKFVEQKGGARYDESKSLVGIKSQEAKLHTQPYRIPDKHLPARREANPLYARDVEVESHLVVNVPRVLTTGGYVSGAPGTGSAKAQATASAGKSKAVNTSSITSSSFPQSQMKEEKSSKKTPKKLSEEGKIKAEPGLFSGIGEMGGMFPEPTPVAAVSAPVNVPVAAVAQPAAATAVNLLDMDMGEEAPKEPATAALEKVFTPQAASKSAPEEHMVKPLGIVTDDFGEKWVAYPDGKVSTQSLPKEKMNVKAAGEKISSAVGFAVVSLLENEGIMAGTVDGTVFLLHFIMADGNATITLKTSAEHASAEKVLQTAAAAVKS